MTLSPRFHVTETVDGFEIVLSFRRDGYSIEEARKIAHSLAESDYNKDNKPVIDHSEKKRTE